MTEANGTITRVPSGAAGADPDEYEIVDQYAAQQAWLALLRGNTRSALPRLTDAQWSWFVQEAARHDLRNLAYRLLADDSTLEPPQSVLEALRPPYVQTAIRNAQLFRETSQIARCLAAQGIPVMLLKGMHLARYVYAEPGLRSMGDVDIMVRREQLAATEQIFLERGYGPTPRPDLEEFCRWSNHLARLTKPNALVYEVHWSIERPTSPFRIDLDGLWARSQSATLDGSPVHLLSVEDLVLHLALHSSYHHRFDRAALKGMADIHAVLVRHADAIDWPVLLERAVAWGASGFLYSTLRLTSLILSTPVPQSFLNDLPRERDDEDVIDVARRFILIPRPELPKAYVKLARSQSLRDRAELLVKSLFLPRAKMERVYGLQRGSRLVWAYYPLRLVTLLFTRTSLSVSALFRTRRMRAPLSREEERLRIQAWVKDLPGDHRPPTDPTGP
jgi:hypothetical protein